MEEADALLHAGQRVVLDTVERVRHEGARGAPLEPRAATRAVVRERVLFLLLLGGDQPDAVTLAREVRLEEVRGDGAPDERGARAEAELPSPAVEVVGA